MTKVSCSTLEYYHRNNLSSTNLISREDGTIIDADEYLPYGLDRSDNNLFKVFDAVDIFGFFNFLYNPVVIIDA